MGKAITIRDIAKEAKVSPTTVSRYLNGTDYVDEQTASRICEVVERFHYRPNRIAQSLKTKETKNLVLVVPDIQNPFYSKMANEMQRFLFEEGYTCLLYTSHRPYRALRHGPGKAVRQVSGPGRAEICPLQGHRPRRDGPSGVSAPPLPRAGAGHGELSRRAAGAARGRLRQRHLRGAGFQPGEQLRVRLHLPQVHLRRARCV